MMRLIMQGFCKTTMYRSIYKNLEVQDCEYALQNIQKLQQQGMIDQELWLKAEVVLFKWMNRLTIPQLQLFAYLMSANQTLISDRAISTLEHKVRQRKLNAQQLTSLIEYMLPMSSEGFRVAMIQKYMQDSTMELNQQLKCLIVIVETSSSCRELILKKLQEYQNCIDQLDLDGILMYLHLYHSGIIQKWIGRVHKREIEQSQLSEILYGFTSPQQSAINYHQTKLDLISKYIGKLEADNKFKLMLIHLLLRKVCKIQQHSYLYESKLLELLHCNIAQLTSNEMSDIVEANHDIAAINQLFQSYLEHHYQQLNEKQIVHFLQLNKRYFANESINSLLMSHLTITLERFGLAELLQCQEVIGMQLNIDKLIQKSIQINPVIDVKIALQLTKLKIGFNMWNKVRINNYSEVGMMTRELHNLIESGVITREEYSEIVKTVTQQFMLD